MGVTHMRLGFLCVEIACSYRVCIGFLLVLRVQKDIRVPQITRRCDCERRGPSLCESPATCLQPVTAGIVDCVAQLFFQLMSHPKLQN